MTGFKRLMPGDPAWLEKAFALEGLSEIVGSKHEPQVVAFFAEAGQPWVKDDETAWCAAFVGAMLVRAGIKGTGSLAARSYLEWGASAAGPVRRGDVVVFSRGSSSWQGHVGFYLGEDAGSIFVIGGNQANSVSVSGYARSRLLGVRRPPAGFIATRDVIEAVQLALIAKGYHEVGLADGVAGRKTASAIRAFEAENGLAVTGEITEGLLARITAAPARPVGEARASGKPEGSRILAGANLTGVTGAGLGVAGLTTIAEPIVAQAESAVGLAGRVRGLFTPLGEMFGATWPIWVLLAGAVLIAAWFITRRARIEDHRTGRTG